MMDVATPIVRFHGIGEFSIPHPLFAPTPCTPTTSYHPGG